MATFLDIVQAVAQDSGTVPTIGDPSTVAGQTDERILQIIDWVNEAWRDIQIKRRDWRWMRGEFSGTTVSGTQRYAASSLGIASRFRRWYLGDKRNLEHFTIYATSEGQSTEVPLVVVRDWDDFYRTYLIGSASSTTGKPTHMCITPDNKIALYPIPDGTGYTIRGMYWKAAQTLTDDADIPEMPADYHDAIKWKALTKLASFDENPLQWASWQDEYTTVMAPLLTDQLEEVGLAPPMA